ncbi:hypothetical protein [Polaribacter sp. Z022]|uniref:hypothetical protein n=1 Tax=Polaribacter sp. Z022 TaxID=2927125 RepID=UPI002020FAED|nr:hypothetical protein [Polaribacter sp. Z022]MCL7752355.1 hypothetical protein [Polaribacter sp. Z022]
MDHKNLDTLFQEQLKNLEVTPDKKVWNNIESKLKEKKKKVFPIWWFTAGGIAAAIVLALLTYPFFNDETELNNLDTKTIITESSKEKTKVESIIKPQKDLQNQQENIEEKVIIAVKKKKQIIKNNTKNKKTLVSTKNAVKKIFLADNSPKNKKNVLTKEKTILKENTITDANNAIKSNKATVTKAEKNISVKKIDLNNYVQKKDSLFSSKKLRKKWSIAPVFAVLNSNSFSNTSPVDRNLSNSTKGKNSYSYGFKLDYKINDRWTIQSGIHIQEMSYVNNEITVESSINQNASSIAFNSGESFSFNGNSNENLDLSSNPIYDTASLNGNLNQNFGYIEVPIEIKYTLLKTNKFNTQIVTGFSSLFLNKNEIKFNSQFLTRSGKATNLNSINFSGNLGLDFNYSLNNNWSLNLNPMFKAQLNTFNKNANNFSPFNLGIYSGIKFNF